jgi:dihydroorotate dehydrogenase
VTRRATTLTSTAYRAVVRPLLFRLSPEQAHRFVLETMRWSWPYRLLEGAWRVRDARLRVDLGGLAADNPVGLGPGIDKNGRAVGALARLGFGFVVIGSITREARPGNPRPRLARDVPREAIMNSLGLPSLGVDAAVRTLGRVRNLPVPVIASVAGFSSEELVELAAAVEPVVDGIEIGLVCPNSTEAERMRELEMFEQVARGVVARRTKPTFVKLPSHHDPETAGNVREMVNRAADLGLDGLSVSGSRTIAIPGFPRDRGSIAGRPAFEDALRITRDVAAWAGGRLPIRSAGGIFDGAGAAAILAAGATAVEVYSAFVYRGPAVAAEINAGLLDELERAGVPSVAALTNANAEPEGRSPPADDGRQPTTGRLPPGQPPGRRRSSCAPRPPGRSPRP